MNTIIPVKCDKCGKMVTGYYSPGEEWWGKYLEDRENKICLNCIKDREGFRDEFKRLIGVSVEQYEESCV